MLAINREPLYKNRLFLSSLAVFSGFLLTVGLLRAMAPVTNEISQSAQSNSERRAASLIPIRASGSESSSESGKSNAGEGQSQGTSKSQASSSGWIAPASTPKGASSSSQPSQASPASSEQQSGSTTPVQPTPTAPTPTPTTPASDPEPTCSVNVLDLVCL